MRRRGALAIVTCCGALLAGRGAEAAEWLDLPQDHAAHPDVPLEWWSFTGHLERSYFDFLIDRVNDLEADLVHPPERGEPTLFFVKTDPAVEGLQRKRYVETDIRAGM